MTPKRYYILYVWRHYGILINPVYGFGIKINQDMNPIYVGMRRYYPKDSKNVSFVDVGLVLACLDFIDSLGGFQEEPS